MFFLVRLDSGEKKIIPSKWVRNFPEYFVKMLNYGINKVKKQSINIFYSKNIGVEPDFTLDILTEFDPVRDACYRAKIITNFGE